MSNSKGLVANLSDVLYSELNKALEKDSKKSSEFIREAIILYIKDKKRFNVIEEMKNGYKEMAELNIQISEYGFESDVKDLCKYEANLSESDLPNDNDSEKRRYILC